MVKGVASLESWFCRTAPNPGGRGRFEATPSSQPQHVRRDPDRPVPVPRGADPAAAAAGARLPDGAGAEEALHAQVGVDHLVKGMTHCVHK